MRDKFIPALNAEIPLSYVGNTPVVTGCVGETEVITLRDTGCSTMIVREDFVAENQKLNERLNLILANSSALITPVAIIDIDTPYLSGKFRALWMETPAYDLEALMGLELQIIQIQIGNAIYVLLLQGPKKIMLKNLFI